MIFPHIFFFNMQTLRGFDNPAKVSVPPPLRLPNALYTIKLHLFFFSPLNIPFLTSHTTPTSQPPLPPFPPSSSSPFSFAVLNVSSTQSPPYPPMDDGAPSPSAAHSPSAVISPRHTVPTSPRNLLEPGTDWEIKVDDVGKVDEELSMEAEAMAELQSKRLREAKLYNSAPMLLGVHTVLCAAVIGICLVNAYGGCNAGGTTQYAGRTEEEHSAAYSRLADSLSTELLLRPFPPHPFDAPSFSRAIDTTNRLLLTLPDHGISSTFLDHLRYATITSDEREALLEDVVLLIERLSLRAFDRIGKGGATGEATRGNSHLYVSQIASRLLLKARTLVSGAPCLLESVARSAAYEEASSLLTTLAHITSQHAEVILRAASLIPTDIEADSHGTAPYTETPLLSAHMLSLRDMLTSECRLGKAQDEYNTARQKDMGKWEAVSIVLFTVLVMIVMEMWGLLCQLRCELTLRLDFLNVEDSNVLIKSHCDTLEAWRVLPPPPPGAASSLSVGTCTPAASMSTSARSRRVESHNSYASFVGIGGGNPGPSLMEVHLKQAVVVLRHLRPFVPAWIFETNQAIAREFLDKSTNSHSKSLSKSLASSRTSSSFFNSRSGSRCSSRAAASVMGELFKPKLSAPKIGLAVTSAEVVDTVLVVINLECIAAIASAAHHQKKTALGEKVYGEFIRMLSEEEAQCEGVFVDITPLHCIVSFSKEYNACRFAVAVDAALGDIVCELFGDAPMLLQRFDRVPAGVTPTSPAKTKKGQPKVEMAKSMSAPQLQIPAGRFNGQTLQLQLVPENERRRLRASISVSKLPSALRGATSTGTFKSFILLGASVQLAYTTERMNTILGTAILCGTQLYGESCGSRNLKTHPAGALRVDGKVVILCSLKRRDMAAEGARSEVEIARSLHCNTLFNLVKSGKYEKAQAALMAYIAKFETVDNVQNLSNMTAHMKGFLEGLMKKKEAFTL